MRADAATCTDTSSTRYKKHAGACLLQYQHIYRPQTRQHSTDKMHSQVVYMLRAFFFNVGLFSVPYNAEIAFSDF